MHNLGKREYFIEDASPKAVRSFGTGILNQSIPHNFFVLFFFDKSLKKHLFTESNLFKVLIPNRFDNINDSEKRLL